MFKIENKCIKNNNNKGFKKLFALAPKQARVTAAELLCKKGRAQRATLSDGKQVCEGWAGGLPCSGGCLAAPKPHAKPSVFTHVHTAHGNACLARNNSVKRRPCYWSIVELNEE